MIIIDHDMDSLFEPVEKVTVLQEGRVLAEMEASGKGLEAFVQTLIDAGDGRGRKSVAAELLGDRLHLPR
jgi:hypothetical protein